MNSLKMKISVLIGVAQMLAGLLLRVGNAIHQRRKLDLLCECVPMILFMLGRLDADAWLEGFCRGAFS